MIWSLKTTQNNLDNTIVKILGTDHAIVTKKSHAIVYTFVGIEDTRHYLRLWPTHVKIAMVSGFIFLHIKFKHHCHILVCLEINGGYYIKNLYPGPGFKPSTLCLKGQTLPTDPQCAKTCKKALFNNSVSLNKIRVVMCRYT